MGRKSKRKLKTEFIRHQGVEKYITGVYSRISVQVGEDKNSIVSQESFVKGYISNILDIEIYKYYSDNGISSFDKNRPAFQEMIEDIKAGAINCVIVKDISRFGRDYIETGSYIESIFPFLGVRFISINDSYDSLYDSASTLQIAFKNLINNFYSHDISKKIKSVIHHKQKSGKYVAAKLPYGYKKDKIGLETRYVVDELLKNVVKKIFELALEGNSGYKIAGYLNRLKEQSPKDSKTGATTHQWTTKAVNRVLQNRMYTGALVTGKTKNVLGAINKVQVVDAKDWIIIENHHEPVIDLKLFNKVQDLRVLQNHNVIKVKKGNIEDFFGNTLFCGDCGRKMKRRVWHSRVYYICPRYEEAKGSCSLKSWREDRLKVEIFHQIKKEIEKADSENDNQNKFEKTISFKLRTKTFQDEIIRFQIEAERYRILKDTMYDHYIEKGRHYNADLSQMMIYTSKKLENLQTSIDVIELKLTKINMTVSSQGINLLELQKYKEIDELTKEVFMNIIKKIRVFNNYIEIYFTWQDNVRSI